MIELSVVIPAYNEENRILPTIKKIHEYLKTKKVEFELLVVDDGSTDRTVEIARGATAFLPSLSVMENGVNRGKGYSVRNGFLNTRGKFVLFSDADLSTPIEELDKFLAEAERGADVVIGSRAMSCSHILRRQPLHRVLMGKAFNRLVRAFAVKGISDTQCGFKLLRRSACEGIIRAQRIDGFAYDVELLFLASRNRLRTKEVPVTWANSPASKVRVLEDSFKMFLDVIRIRWRDAAGRDIRLHPSREAAPYLNK
ncbi:MAG: dolichyl-phosphate beta-glucosyltransferase [Nitrospirota bacterium]